MVGKYFSSKPGVVEDAHYMFDKMLQPVPVSLTLDLGYDATELGSIYGSYKSRLDGVTMETKAVFDKGVGENESRYNFEDMSHPNSVGMVKAQGDRSNLNILCLFMFGNITALSDIDDKDTCSEAMGVKDIRDSPFPETIKGLYGLWASNAVNMLCLFRLHAIEFETYECKYAISFNVIEELFYFDPGGCSFSQMGSDPFEFNGAKGEFGLTLTVVDTLIKAIKHKSQDVILLIINAVIFYFDPGGCHLPQMGCDLFENDGLKRIVDDAFVKAKEYCAKDFGENLETNGLSLKQACKNIENNSFSVGVLISTRGSYVIFFTKGALCPLISKASWNKHCHFGTNYFYLFSSATQNIMIVKVDSGTYEDDCPTVDAKAMFEGAIF